MADAPTLADYFNSTILGRGMSAVGGALGSAAATYGQNLRAMNVPVDSVPLGGPPPAIPAPATNSTGAAPATGVAQPALVAPTGGQMTAEEWARQNIGKITPYQLKLQRAMAAPLVSPQNMLMHQQIADENAEYAQRAADYKAGKPVLGGADGKTPLGPHDIFNDHQTALGNIARANPMYQMGTAGMVTSPTGN